MQNDNQFNNYVVCHTNMSNVFFILDIVFFSTNVENLFYCKTEKFNLIYDYFSLTNLMCETFETRCNKLYVYKTIMKAKMPKFNLLFSDKYLP